MTDSDTPARPVIDRRTTDNMSWQRTDLGNGGRYTGRDYYDNRLAEPGEPVLKPVPPTSQVAGRGLRITGTVVALAGLAGWLWLVLAFVSSVGDGAVPDDPFSARFAGIPLGSGGLVAILVGGVLSALGSWVVKASRDRRGPMRW